MTRWSDSGAGSRPRGGLRGGDSVGVGRTGELSGNGEGSSPLPSRTAAAAAETDLMTFTADGGCSLF